MKKIEYLYNVIYYFFYRGAIKFAVFIRGRYNPLIFFLYLFYSIPYVKNRFKNKGIDDPLEWHLGYKKDVMKTSIGNPKGSAGTMIGAGLSISVVMFMYIGFYHIIKHLVFPTFEDSFGYVLTVTATLAFTTDVIFSQIDNKDEKYIKEFNKKKGWWRVKWSIITALTPFIVIWFSISTSEGGMIGNYLLSLSGNYTYPTAQEKLEQENRMKLIKSGEIKIQPIDVK